MNEFIHINIYKYNMKDEEIWKNAKRSWTVGVSE